MQANTYAKVTLAALLLAATTAGAQNHVDQAGQDLPTVQLPPGPGVGFCPPETALESANEQLLKLAVAMSQKAGNSPGYMQEYRQKEATQNLTPSQIASARAMLLRVLGNKIGIP